MEGVFQAKRRSIKKALWLKWSLMHFRSWKAILAITQQEEKDGLWWTWRRRQGCSEAPEKRWLDLHLNGFFVVVCCCCSDAQSCLCQTLCNPMDFITPCLPVLHYLLEFAKTHIQWVRYAIQPSRPLLTPSPAFNLSQHQGLWSFKWLLLCLLLEDGQDVWLSLECAESH